MRRENSASSFLYRQMLSSPEPITSRHRGNLSSGASQHFQKVGYQERWGREGGKVVFFNSQVFMRSDKSVPESWPQIFPFVRNISEQWFLIIDKRTLYGLHVHQKVKKKKKCNFRTLRLFFATWLLPLREKNTWFLRGIKKDKLYSVKFNNNTWCELSSEIPQSERKGTWRPKNNIYKACSSRRAQPKERFIWWFCCLKYLRLIRHKLAVV